MIRADGVFGPCCKVSSYETDINAHKVGLSNLFTSSLFKDIRNQFEKNLWPKQCQRCKQEEDAGIKSHRQKALARFGTDFSQPEAPQVLELSFGNICNAACVICDNGNSSKWLNDSQYINEKFPQVFSRHVIGIYDHDFSQWSDEDLTKIQVLQLGQSEALVQKGFKSFLRRLAKLDKIKDLSIELNTNGGVFPDPEILEILKAAHHVEVQISIDGLNAEFEYLRYPLKWSVVERNVFLWAQFASETPRFHLTCRFTFSALNVTSYSEVKHWWEEKVRRPYQTNIGSLNHGYVKWPSYLRPGLRPQSKSFVGIPSDIQRLMSEMDESSDDYKYDQKRLEMFLQILKDRRSSLHPIDS